MRLLSWNVNGLRSIHRNGYWGKFLNESNESADIFCLQETKAGEEQLPHDVRNISGYISYFSSSRHKKGYSGVGTWSKLKPEKVEYGIGIPRFDDEGRVLALYFNEFILFNVYFPNGGGGLERLAYKLDFYDAFLKHIEILRQTEGKKIIFCGDVNTAHEEIDLARPKENEKNTGFLPEERAWIDEVIAQGYIDTFRHFYPEKRATYSYWDTKTRARDRNVGWRIDYFFISGELEPLLAKAFVLPHIYGSDHCPVGIELAL